MKELMQGLRDSSIKAILEADDIELLESLRVKYLGKKGELTGILRQMGKLSAEERPVMGQLANQLRGDIEAAIEQRKAELGSKLMELKLEREAVDVTLPGETSTLGHKHPMYNVLDQIKDIFIGMGFEILDGPEVEKAEYNFTKLNIDEGHPSREWTDTFQGRQQHPAAHSDLPDADTRDGDPPPAHPHRRPRPRLPQGRGRCNALPDVPPD